VSHVVDVLVKLKLYDLLMMQDGLLSMMLTIC